MAGYYPSLCENRFVVTLYDVFTDDLLGLDLHITVKLSKSKHGLTDDL